MITLDHEICIAVPCGWTALLGGLPSAPLWRAKICVLPILYGPTLKRHLRLVVVAVVEMEALSEPRQDSAHNRRVCDAVM